jgi:hypothetical protein
MLSCRECCRPKFFACFVQGFDGDALTQSPLRNRVPGGVTTAPPIFTALQPPDGQIGLIEQMSNLFGTDESALKAYQSDMSKLLGTDVSADVSALKAEQSEIVQMLISAGADVNAVMS